MLLNDSWTMIDGDHRYSCSVPCSAMQVLLREGVIPDPYYRENEWISTPVSERDFTFEKSVCLGLKTHDAVFSDNWFDIHGGRPVTVTLPKSGELAGLSAEDLEKDLQIMHY